MFSIRPEREKIWKKFKRNQHRRFHRGEAEVKRLKLAHRDFSLPDRASVHSSEKCHLVEKQLGARKISLYGENNRKNQQSYLTMKANPLPSSFEFNLHRLATETNMIMIKSSSYHSSIYCTSPSM